MCYDKLISRRSREAILKWQNNFSFGSRVVPPDGASKRERKLFSGRQVEWWGRLISWQWKGIPKQFIHTMFQDSTNDEGDEFRPPPKMILFLLPSPDVEGGDHHFALGYFPSNNNARCVCVVCCLWFWWRGEPSNEVHGRVDCRLVYYCKRSVISIFINSVM